VLAALQSGGWQVRVGLERRQQLVEAEVLDREAELDRPDAKSYKQMTFPDTRRPLHQDHLGVADPGAGGERLDARSLDRGLEGEVEVLQRLAGGDLRGLEHRPDAPLFPAGSLRVQQPVQEDMGRHLGAHRFGQQAFQGVHRVAEAERGELLPRRVDVELHARGGHRATSASRA
jgi:hypothetical protein